MQHPDGTRSYAVALCIAAAVAAAPATVHAQHAQRARTGSFTLEDVLGAPFPKELVAAPTGGRIAWVFDERGSRNVWVAEPSANGSYAARALTSYVGDDGADIENLTWARNGEALVYTRGGPFNPHSLPQGASGQHLFAVSVRDGVPHALGDGSAPAISPRGDVVAYVAGNRVFLARMDGQEKAAPIIHDQGTVSSLTWSPDGSRLAFVSGRGTHNLVGVYEAADKPLVWLAPGVDRDMNPVWSPDGRRIAFVRVPAGSAGPLSGSHAGPPWSIWVADATTGAGHKIWTADAGDGSLFYNLEGESAFAWGAGDRIVFPWEKTGWVHLYSVAASGGAATLLTPGNFEVFSADLTPDRRDVIYSSNQGDLDRRHIWRVPAAGGAQPVALTTGDGIEDMPVSIGDGRVVALLHATALTPMRPAITTGAGAVHELAVSATPAGFPAAHLVTPQGVIFKSPDGMPIHAQLFLPPKSATGVRRPALIFFHGGPPRQMLLGPNPMEAYTYMYGMNQYFANHGYVVLSVNYRGGTGYGLDFRVPANFGPMGASESNDIVGAKNYLASRSDVDDTRIGVWGGSYGGYMTALALARYSNMFAAGVDYAGVHNWKTLLRGLPFNAPVPTAAGAADVVWTSSPLASIKQWSSPVLVIQADNDHNVPFAQTVELVEALRKQGVPYELLTIPDEIHDLLMHQSWLQYFHAQSDFFDRHLRMSSSGASDTTSN